MAIEEEKVYRRDNPIGSRNNTSAPPKAQTSSTVEDKAVRRSLRKPVTRRVPDQGSSRSAAGKTPLLRRDERSAFASPDISAPMRAVGDDEYPSTSSPPFRPNYALYDEGMSAHISDAESDSVQPDNASISSYSIPQHNLVGPSNAASTSSHLAVGHTGASATTWPSGGQIQLLSGGSQSSRSNGPTNTYNDVMTLLPTIIPFAIDSQEYNDISSFVLFQIMENANNAADALAAATSMSMKSSLIRLILKKHGKM
ncbi:hypothetical protein BDZ89DRAFT_1045300 [Hymenopellis radicata]|nr:hypothetical protein BDZ89DRAFT_1045300 [Hymenopellis radicata]